MNDAAKKVASTAGAKGAKGQKGIKSPVPSFPDVTPAGQSMAELDAMLAAAKPGATPSLVARAARLRPRKLLKLLRPCVCTLPKSSAVA